MGVRVISLDITPELSTDTTDFLLGNIMQKMVASIRVKAEWILAGDGFSQEACFSGNNAYFIPQGGATTDLVGVNWESEPNKFRVGDSIEISNSLGSFATTTRTITSISSDGLIITFDGAAFGATTYAGITTFTGVTECTGINFRYNLIENNDSEDYKSLTDNNELKFSKGDLDYMVLTDVDAPQQGVYASNHLGSTQIKGTATLNEFIITHTFYITPFYLHTQLTDLQSKKAPIYFFDSDCLKYIYNVEMLYNISDPNRIHTSNESFLIGNTGWFNENFNAGIPKFTIDPVVFKQAGSPIDYADYDGITDVEITIRSEDGVFSNNNTKFVVNHILLPEEENEYIDTATDQEENFMFDRALQTVGSAAVNGDQYGTAKQVLTDIAATFVSANEVLITAKIDLSSEYKTKVAALQNKNFFLAVTVQDHTKQTLDSDIVTLFDEIFEYDVDLSNEGVGDITTEFNFYPSISVGSTTAGNFIEDTLRGNSIIGVDIANGALIKDISVIIRAENGSDSFVMEQKDFSFSGAVISGGVQQINTIQPRGFVLKSDNPFYNMSLIRRADLDSGSVKKYQLIYPFKIRWEDFIQLASADSDFYDINEPFNGFNQNWARYFDGAGWSLKYVVRANIEENGVVNAVALESDLLAYDYEEATDWTQNIKVYDIDTNLEIPNSVLSDKIVRVVAEFTKIAGALPDIADVAGMIEYEPFEQGGIYTIRNISTLYEHESGSPFISTLGNKLLDKSKTLNVYTFTANIDGKLLTGQPKLSARIYDLTVPPFGSSKEFQDGDAFEFQDGVAYDFQG